MLMPLLPHMRARNSSNHPYRLPAHPRLRATVAQLRLVGDRVAPPPPPPPLLLLNPPTVANKSHRLPPLLPLPAASCFIPEGRPRRTLTSPGGSSCTCLCGHTPHTQRGKAEATQHTTAGRVQVHSSGRVVVQLSGRFLPVQTAMLNPACKPMQGAAQAERLSDNGRLWQPLHGRKNTAACTLAQRELHQAPPATHPTSSRQCV